MSESELSEEKKKIIKENLEASENLDKEEKLRDIDKVRGTVNESYDKIIDILKEYCDMREEYYDLVATWIIGTYVYESFNTYPYLFINAMRGSGKSRLLNLIRSLSHNGEMVASMTEAVLFRTAKGKTLCIDEIEGINRKEKAPLRELLNSCYKKGVKIQRMRKRKTIDGEQQIVEDFEPYTPICLANIFGMEEVLSDRCITFILEKSKDPMRTKLIEDFDKNPDVLCTKGILNLSLVYMCSYFSEYTYIKEWNNYIKSHYTTYTTLTTLTTLNTLTTPTFRELQQQEMFRKIDETNINGRNLELIFPLLIISSFLGEERFDKMLKIAKNVIEERKGEEMVESRDVALIDYVSRQIVDDYLSIKELTSAFRSFLGDDDAEDERWLNSKWIGRALRRLNLITDKRRVGTGIEIRLNIKNALEKIKIFRKEGVEKKSNDTKTT